MDWNNVDLEDVYERQQNILDPYSFDTLLLEINCNIRDINKDSVREQFLMELNLKVKTAKEIFAANIDNITRQAIKERNKE